MASNPMQRKARNSFLLGMLLMLVIAAVIIAFLVMQLLNTNKRIQEERGKKINVYTLNCDVGAGVEITKDMLELTETYENFVPSNAVGDLNVLNDFALTDKAGNPVTTEYVSEVEKENNQSNNRATNETSNETTNQTSSTNNKGDIALYIERGDSGKMRIEKEELTGEYYIVSNENGQKEYIELNTVPLVSKVALNKNTVITTDMLSKSDELNNDVRREEYNMVVLPTDLQTDDYVDIRVMFPSGQNYIVLSKKQVEIPDLGGVPSEDTIIMKLSEDEILHMSCAIVDTFQVPGAKLYATKYSDPGIQEAATETYPMDETTIRLLQSDPNVVDQAMEEIRQRYSSYNNASVTLRSNIDEEINAQGDQSKSNYETKMEESITNSKNSRKEYLESLGAPVQ